MGLMPAVLDGNTYTGFTAGCYLAVSTNGLDWTAPRLLVSSWAIGPRVEVSYEAVHNCTALSFAYPRKSYDQTDVCMPFVSRFPSRALLSNTQRTTRCISISRGGYCWS